MTHFGLIKLESSNLLDITIDALLNIPNYISQIYKWCILLAVKQSSKAVVGKKYVTIPYYIKLIGFQPAAGKYFEICPAAGDNS